MQRIGHLDQNAGAAMFFTGELIQAKGFEGGAKLGCQNCDFRDCILVESPFWGTAQEGNRAYHFAGNQEGRGERGMGMALGYPGIACYVEVIDEERATFLHRIHRDGCITGAPPDAAEGAGVVGIGLGAD
jgi:hypothetical protein